MLISIHAPREGCDSLRRKEPNHPSIFQSTHPVRGATRPHPAFQHRPRISIHAPREGCDPLSPFTIEWGVEFQSTHPVRGATVVGAVVFGDVLISIHAPREGCDLVPSGAQSRGLVISIHAPREGCDPSMPAGTAPLAKFQSTHPVRGATEHARRPVPTDEISIHAPREGCD